MLNYGVCFEISDNTDLYPFGKLTEEDLIFSDFHIDTVDNLDEAFAELTFEVESFVNRLDASEHVSVSPGKNENELKLIFAKPFKHEHFASRFDALKKHVQTMSCDDFSNDNLIPWRLMHCIRDDRTLIYYNHDVIAFDDFVRSMQPKHEYYLSLTNAWLTF